MAYVLCEVRINNLYGVVLVLHTLILKKAQNPLIDNTYPAIPVQALL